MGVAACVIIVAALGTATAAEYWVAPSGDDAGAGTKERPWRSLHRALAPEPGLEPGDTIWVRGGVYELSEPLAFTPEHSGAPGSPVTIAAQPGEEVIIRGARSVTGWQLWREGIYRADLAAQGLEGARFHQLFYRGERQPLARHPDFDPEHPRTGGFVYVEDKGPRPFEQFIYADGDVPFDAWGDISQVEVWTVFGRGWNFALTPVVDVDREHRIITTRRVRRHFERMNRYFIQNVLGALDSPGEWFLDYETSALYFHPPDGPPADGDVLVPVLDNIIEVRGSLPYPHGYLHVGYKGSRDEFEMPGDPPEDNPVHDLVFRGLRVECSRHSGLLLTGARDCALIGCVVTGIGNVGINLGGVANAHEEVGNPRVEPFEGFSGGVGGGGQNTLFNDPCQGCRVEGCDVFSCGADGIFLYGTGNLAENNHVFNIGLFDKDCACVSLWGEENVARRNNLHDAPRNAIYLKGIDNVAELNDIHHTMLETCDGGAIRMCQRNLTMRGNVIRHNRILDTVGYGYPYTSRTFQSPYYSWGVYLDDFTCGTTVEGNIIARVGRGGVMLHGGSDNIVTGNIVVDAAVAQLEQAPIRDKSISGNVFAHNVLVYGSADALAYRSTKWVDGSLTFDRNLVWAFGNPVCVDLGRGGQAFDDWPSWMGHGLDSGSIVAEPRFVDAANDDYRLAPDSPAWELGFQEMPVDQIGCYRSPARASWPLDTNAGVVREEHLLYTQPVQPIREDFEIDVVGRPPRHGDVMAGPEAAIVVTEEQAAGGEHSLKVLDAPGLRQLWLPRIYYPLEHREGRVRFSCDLLLDAERPPRLYIDPRQYSDTGEAEYFNGPMLVIAPDGTISSRQGQLARVPRGTWFTIQLDFVLGDDAPDSTAMVLTVRGEEPVELEVPHARPEFQHLERIVFASLTDSKSVFYLDNIAIEPITE